MTKIKTSFRLSEETKKMLEYLAEKEKRSQTGELEYLIEKRYEELRKSE